ncbi:MAG: cell division protein FtsA [Patescibacteria group bacterium]|mgnify:CR=1 FL=1
MARTNYTCGIDVGTHTTRVVVMGYAKEDKTPYLLATGLASTMGMRLGYITNIDHVTKSIKDAVAQAEKTLGYKIKRACVSIGGISLGSIVSNGQVIISRADQEVTHLDISKALADSEENLEILNKKIIHMIPVGYKLDGKDLHGRPEGMKGVKLEVKTLFITCLKQNIEDLITALGLAGIEVEDVVASPLASAMILLNHKQKAAGCALIDIGAETVSIAVFENSLLMSLQVFSIGSMDITKDVALGFRIALEEAESLKLGSVIGGDYPKKKVDEIIEARLSDIFELVGNHLKRQRRYELLPAGVIITGGGSHINRIEELARAQLKLPCRVGPIDGSINSKLKIRDFSWYTAFGLALSATDGSVNNNREHSIGDNVNQVKGFFKSLLSQLLP